MDNKNSIIPSESIPFILEEESRNKNIIFISNNHKFLEELHHNLQFFGCSVNILAPKFSFFINHSGLDDNTFISQYISSSLRQKNITLIHSSLLFYPLPLPSNFHTVSVKTGTILSQKDLTSHLINFGYSNVPIVYNHFEFSNRGYIIDLSTSEQFIRIEFLGNAIEQIKTFNPHSQITEDTLTEINLNTTKLINTINHSNFKANYQITFKEDNPDLYHAMEHHPESCDVNKYIKLLAPQTINILETLTGQIFLDNTTIESIINQHTQDFTLFEKTSNIKYDSLYFNTTHIQNTFNKFTNSVIASM